MNEFSKNVCILIYLVASHAHCRFQSFLSEELQSDYRYLWREVIITADVYGGAQHYWSPEKTQMIYIRKEIILL